VELFPNRFSQPVKLYEYLASGLTVVSTEIPSIAEYRNYPNIWIANNVGEMVDLISKPKNELDQKSIEKIQELLNKQSVKEKIKNIISYL